jgi:hypothetical protein
MITILSLDFSQNPKKPPFLMQNNKKPPFLRGVGGINPDVYKI